MVIFDLAVLNLTALPAISHDSLILKNISDGSIDGIMKIYASSKMRIQMKRKKSLKIIECLNFQITIVSFMVSRGM